MCVLPSLPLVEQGNTHGPVVLFWGLVVVMAPVLGVWLGSFDPEV
jgi:hypothetical protein